ncbi:sigma-54 interaction domain-containing protein [Bacteroidota bacterium]
MSISDKLKDHILDSIGEGVFTVDKDFKINFFNKAAEKITGYRREEVNGKFCKHIFKSKICFTDCPIALVLKSDKNIYDFDSNIRGSSGERIPIKLNSAVLYNENAEPTGGIITFRDMSELELLKRNLEQETNFHGVIGTSKPMKEIFSLIDEISDSDATVFIHGESGTGKEVIADAIYKTSQRNEKPFIKINCSVLPSNLLASELFGHVKGAFTGAIKDRVGRFEIADGGTIFLDEVAEMPLQMQLQLLRVIQEGTFERVGESITRHVNVRVIAATNINIKEALKKGTFREDLYYRLSVIPIEIPPLRSHPVDIIPLVKHFLRKYSILYKKDIHELEDRALDMLMKYDWPGNIRELENVIEFAFVRSNSETIIPASKLPENIRNPQSAQKTIIPQTADDADSSLLLDVLEKHRWNKSKAAKELGMGRTTLWRKLKQLGMIDN